jgi:hypothetical protein
MEIIADNQFFLTITLSSEDFSKVIEGKLIPITPEVIKAATWGRRCRLVDVATRMEIYYYLHSFLPSSKGDYGYWVRNIRMNDCRRESVAEAGFYN